MHRKRHRSLPRSPASATAYALTRAAHDLNLDRAKALLMATELSSQLDGDTEWATRLYAHIATLTGADVDIAALERQFGFVLEPKQVHQHMHDPYSSRDLKREVEVSFAELLRGIDRTCTTLPGLDANEAGLDAQREVDGALNTLWHRLAPMLSDREATQQSLREAAATALSQIAAEACRRAVRRIENQQAGVRALQKLCAAGTEGRDMDAVLEESGDVLASMLFSPPASFVDEMSRMRVPVVELATYLRPPFGRVPICGAAKSLSIGRWAMTYAPHVDTVCVGVLQELRCAAHLEPEHVAWHGIGVWGEGDDRTSIAMATGGPFCAVPCPRATHTHGCDAVTIAATRTSQCTALRSVRVARTVCELVYQGRIRPRHVCAEGLLALVSRFNSEACIQRQQLDVQMAAHMDDEERAEAMEGEEDEEAEEEEEEEAEESDEAIDYGAPTAYPVSLVAPRDETTSEALCAADSVPQALQRDYVLLVLLRAVSMRENASNLHISVSSVVDRLGLTIEGGEAATALRAHTRPSLQQSAGFVMTKAVTKMREWATEHREQCLESDVGYGRLPSWAPGTKGVNANERGKAVFERFLTHAIRSMQDDGTAFANWWFPSRSAKCHARRKREGREGPGGGGTARSRPAISCAQ